MRLVVLELLESGAFHGSTGVDGKEHSNGARVGVHGEVGLPRDDGHGVQVRDVVDQDAASVGANPQVPVRRQDRCHVDGGGQADPVLKFAT